MSLALSITNWTLFAFTLVLSLLGEYDSCFANTIEEEVGAHVSNTMFFVGMCVSLIVVLHIACNGFIIAENDGRDGEISGLLFDFMEGDDVDDIDGGCALGIIDGIDDGTNDGSFDSSLNNMFLNATIIGSLALPSFVVSNEQ